jgi:hypothetical protein
MSPDRVKKEKFMDDLQYLHYQTQLEEQERDELLANGLLLPEVRTQADNSNQTIDGEKK